MKDYQKLPATKAETEAISQHKDVSAPTTGAIRPRWQGTRIEALSSKKLWSILRQLEHDPIAPDPEAEAAIMDELLARGNHTHRTQWQAPH